MIIYNTIKRMLREIVEEVIKECKKNQIEVDEANEVGEVEDNL